MKTKCFKFLVFVFLFGFSVSLFHGVSYAAVPKLMTYQGVLKDSSGNYLTGTYSMTFRLYSASSGGSALWTETQSSVSASSGKFSVQLGSVTALGLDFNADYWLSIQVGADAEMSPRVRLTSVGYGIRADYEVNGFTQATHDAMSHKNIEGVKDNTVNLAKTNFKLDAYSVASANSMGDMIVDTFNDATGINSGASSGYTWRNSSNYDVVVTSTYSDQTGSGTASASSSYSGNPASEAFDNTLTSSYEWSSDAVPSTGTPQWLKYDFGSGNAKTITRYTISNAESYPFNQSRAPKDWTFEGSNDDSAWTTLDTRSNVTWSCDACTKTYDFTNSTAYRYYRIKITANNGGPTFVEISEMEIIQATTSGSATVISVAYTEPSAPTEAIVIPDETLGTGSITYYVSRDNGTTWTQCTKETATSISSQPSGTQLKWKAVITGNAELNSIAVGV